MKNQMPGEYLVSEEEEINFAIIFINIMYISVNTV